MYLYLVSDTWKVCNVEICTKNTEADFASGIHVWVEAAATAISGQASHGRRLYRVCVPELCLELEEAELVRRIRRSDDEAAHGTNIIFTVGDSKR